MKNLYFQWEQIKQQICFFTSNLPSKGVRNWNRARNKGAKRKQDKLCAQRWERMFYFIRDFLTNE